MTTGMKVAIGSAIAGALFELLNGHVITAAWASLAAFWMWKHDKARAEVAALEASAHSKWLHDNVNGHGIPDRQPTRFVRSPEYEVTPEQLERIFEVINEGDQYAKGGRIEASTTFHRTTTTEGTRATPQHHSMGGLQPHMCVCGKPLGDH